MKIVQPRPFTFQAGPRAVLLLHGFTGHSADVRMLGRFLEKKGYSSHAPIYRGHGLAPEALLDVHPEDFWEDVLAAFNHLKELGYQEIAVAGLSLGGALGLKLAYSEKIKAIIPMCTPMFFDNEAQLTAGFKTFAKEYKQLERKDEATIEAELKEMEVPALEVLKEMGSFITSVSKEVDSIYTPIMVVQAEKDEMINPESANYIYEQVESDYKEIKWYKNSGHVITLGQEKEVLYEDIYQFLETLDWEE